MNINIFFFFYYSVVVDEAVNSLVINYKVKEGYRVDVEQNQNLKAGEKS